MKSTSYEAPHYAVFPESCHFSPLRSKYSTQHPVLKHPQSIAIQRVLTMLCNTQNRRVSGLRPPSRILHNYKTTFRKLDVFPSSDEGRETPALLGPLERDNLNHWTWSRFFLPSSEDGNKSYFQHPVFYSYL
jgi:hypothetical protein